MKWSVAVVVILFIVFVVVGIYLVAVAVVAVLGLPWDMGLPPAVRLVGLGPLLAGAFLFGWLLKYRRFRDILESNHASLVKGFRRAPLEERLDRTEPLVVVGPYRIVRHPMYSGIGMMVVGIGILTDHTWALLGAILLCLYFAFIVAPFEERELKALFGRDYEEYMRVTPRIVPLPRRTWRRP